MTSLIATPTRVALSNDQKSSKSFPYPSTKIYPIKTEWLWKPERKNTFVKGRSSIQSMYERILITLKLSTKLTQWRTGIIGDGDIELGKHSTRQPKRVVGSMPRPYPSITA